MNNYGKGKELPCLQYWDVNNLYDWVMSQKLLVNNFEWIEDSDEVAFEFYVQYSEKLHELHTDLLLLPESMKIEKVEKPVSNLRDKK